MKGRGLESLIESNNKVESRKGSSDPNNDDCCAEEVKTDSTTPKHKFDLFIVEPQELKNSTNEVEELKSDKNKQSIDDYRRTVLEGGYGSLVPSLQLSPPRIFSIELNPKITPLLIDWKLKDFETLRNRYFRITKVISGLYFHLFNDRNEFIERVFVRFHSQLS